MSRPVCECVCGHVCEYMSVWKCLWFTTLCRVWHTVGLEWLNAEHGRGFLSPGALGILAVSLRSCVTWSPGLSAPQVTQLLDAGNKVCLTDLHCAVSESAVCRAWSVAELSPSMSKADASCIGPPQILAAALEGRSVWAQVHLPLTAPFRKGLSPSTLGPLPGS